MKKQFREITINLLKKHEGFRRKPYKCSEGKLTIGYGFNLEDVGLDKEECDIIIQNRVTKIHEQLLKKYQWYSPLSKVRKIVIIDMVYNLGFKKFHNFKKTIAYISKRKYQEASEEMLKSKWANQVYQRAQKLSILMETGKIIK